ncbi:MAG: protein kinase [Candidatus Latescibacterota bacterium]|nr:MAG: protein kinase [Candidatus Latescibacterota bacterium]
MIGQTISHYKILEMLGEGGMGVVYRAKDLKLKRIVALKFLPTGLTQDEDAKKRFLREAQGASALQHNNICTIHEIDETPDGRFFMCMDFYRGETLKDKTARGPMPVDEAIGFAIQVAEGLARAHRAGMVHRDIKSANIMVTEDNVVKILDFGVAKLTGVTEVTRTGTVLGTASYLSPEQARGDKIDHRTDIWSLGILLYEMLTGELPFKGDFGPAVVYAILHGDPVPLEELRPDISVEVRRIVERAMTKDRVHRYQDVGRMLEHLRAPATVTDSGWTPEVAAPKKPERSIAVLPFVNMSADKDQDYFCDGIADEIINALAKVDDLRVTARTSSFSFKEKNQDIREIGRKLNVETVLEGSVRRVENRVRVTGQLINVSDGYHLWSDQYNRELEDIFVIQEEIAESIVQALKLQLTEREKRAIERAPTKNVQAYDYYLRGRKFFYQSKRSGIEFACEMFSKAIKTDPDYALAHAGLADCHSYLCLYFGGGEEHMSKAQESSATALELDPELAEAHAARGLALSVGKRYDEAEREFNIAILLDPKLFEGYYFYARTCFAQGKFEKAIEMYHRAGEVNPEDYQAPSLEAFTYRTMKRMEEAKEVYRRSLEAIEKHLDFNPDDSRAIYLGATALIDLGEPERARRWVRRAEAIDPEDPYLLYGVACFHSRLGDADEAVRYLEKAFGAGFAHKDWVEHDSDFDPIKDDPRFRALVDGMEQQDQRTDG